VLQAFPFLAWAAPFVSAVLLLVTWGFGESRGARLVIETVLFAVALYAQFLASAPAAHRVGLPLQTILAIYLLVRWRLDRALAGRVSRRGAR
jgi:hypothetical protein